MTAGKLLRYSAPVVLLALVLSVYGQVGGHAFVNVDDDQYVSGNPFVLRGLTPEGVSWAFTTFHTGNWHPLTWISHMLDVELFGPSPGWHHRVNLGYHLLNTELLFLVLWRMTGGFWQSVFAAALFGVHPLNVESVAWVAERKNLLSTLFWIAAMGAYLGYARRPGVGRYLLVAAAFSLGLMSKPMLVTLPFALLLLDWWPLGRMTPSGSPDLPPGPPSASVLVRLTWEKVPLFALSAASCVVTYLAQAGSGTVVDLGRFPFWSRVSNAVVSFAGYLWKTAWPSSLAVFYPHPASFHAGLPGWKIAAAALLLVGISVLALREAGRRPFLLVGWLWYLGTLVPVIGLVQVGGQALADRYAYVPLIGVFLAAAWGIGAAISGPRSRLLALGMSGAAVAALSAAAWVQAGYWRDSPTLLSHAVAVTDRNWFALNNLGNFHYANGEDRLAIGYFRESLRIKPDFAAGWNNLGATFRQLGDHPQAIGCFEEALRIRSDFAEAWYNLGKSRSALGQDLRAAADYREAVRIRPDFAAAWNDLGISRGKLGMYREAIGDFREAVRIRPDFAEAWYNLGSSFVKLGEAREAIGNFREAVRIRPGFPEARRKLGELEGGPSGTGNR